MYCNVTHASGVYANFSPVVQCIKIVPIEPLIVMMKIIILNFRFIKYQLEFAKALLFFVVFIEKQNLFEKKLQACMCLHVNFQNVSQ